MEGELLGDPNRPPNRKQEEIEDVHLVRAAQRGKREAFERLVSRYHGMLFDIVHRKIRDISTVEDIVQETLLSAYRAIGQCRKPESFRFWLFTIARNTLRKTFLKSAHTSSNLDDLADVEKEQVSEAPDPRRLAVLEESLQVLSRDMYQVVILKYKHKMTCEEIAVSMRKPLGTVRSWLVRAHERLKTEMESRLREKGS